MTEMIKNERQYRITKAQMDRFGDSLSELRQKSDAEMHPIQRRVQIDALQSQHKELKMLVDEYEALREGKLSVLELHSFDEIPDALIKARIASGMSQKDLAEKIGLKEQQIQRYEATGYQSASMARMSEVANALGISIMENVFLPQIDISPQKLFNQLIKVGIRDEFVIKRILPTDLVESIQNQASSDAIKPLVLKAANTLSHIFRWDVTSLFDDSDLDLSSAIAGSTRFKVTGRADGRHLNFYTMYAYYLASLVLKASQHLDPQPIPIDPIEFRNAVIRLYGNIDFENTLRYIWGLGIPVIPLDDEGAFHGACWREDGRNVIVLKQQTSSLSRWHFDLLHEFRHTGEQPDMQSFVVIEADETSEERLNSDSERQASMFAGNVLLNGRSEELVVEILKLSKRKVPGFKSAVERIASRHKMPTAGLANYLAFRLSLQGQNWWPTASNLQEHGEPVDIARRIMFENIDLSYLSNLERDVLMRSQSDF